MTANKSNDYTTNQLTQVAKIYAFFNQDITLKLVDNVIKVFFNKNINLPQKEKNIEFIKNNKIYLIKLLKNNNSLINSSIFIIRFPKNIKNILSYAQERLWFIERYEGGSSAYNIPMVYRISGDADINLLSSSIQSILMRHDILRTVIREDEEGRGYQQVLDFSDEFYHLQKIKVTNRQDLQTAISQESNRAFDLENEYPIRVCFYELDDSPTGQNENYVSIVVHHIAFDGWSLDIFWKELHAYYNYYAQQKEGITEDLNLPELTIQYKDFALWQRNYLSGERLGTQLSYWLNKLAGYEPLALITDKTRPPEIDYTGQDIHFQLTQETSQALRTLAKDLKVSLYSLLLSAYYLMLRGYSYQNDLIVGTPAFNRHYAQIEHLIGFFVNSLAIRVKVDETFLITDFIKHVSEIVIDAQAHQDLPFEMLVEGLKVDQDTSRHPLFQVMFGLDASGGKNIESSIAPEDKTTPLLEQYVNAYDIHNIAKFDLSVFVDDQKDCLSGVFNYAVSLFNEQTIKGFVETYQTILGQFAELKSTNQNPQIQHLNYLPLNQYEKMIKDWNATDILYGSDQTIIDFFEEQVGKTPDAIAVIYEENQLTYMQLNQKANQLAHHLRQTYAISPDDPIALCLDRNEQMLIGILGILKAGGCYVPIGPNYPDERVKYILNDTNTKVVLVNEIHQKKLQNLLQKADVLVLDCPLMQMKLSDSPVTNPSPLALSSSLAYIIYTSGTTGNPKGVMIEHRGVVNRIQWMNQTYPLTEHDRILQKTPYVFDVSVWELLWAHWYGATIVFAKPEGHKDAAYIKEIISKERVTITHFVPSMLSVFEETLDHIGSDLHEDLANLRYIFCSGEALSLEQVTKCHHLLPWVSVHNLYGPTEASIDVLSYDCSDPEIKAVYIGKPIANTTAYVLNSSLQPVPIGGIGELHIGGMGLARGYLNQPELTAEKFIGNPFQSEEEKISGRNDRLYKTGDLVRWLSDGNIEYIGRNDFQVKIRGHRIELGEIESLLSTYEGIKQSVVVAKNHESTDGKGHLYLGGYYVSDHPLNEDEIRSYLHSQLPDYMVPTFLMWVASLPLTINGKLDRKALPTPELSHQETYIAPRSEEERKICSIWGEVLGLSSQVGIRDDFFRLGGDSIMSIQLTSRLRQRLGLTVSVRDIFKFRTIERLYDHILSTSLHKVDQIIIQSEQGLLEGEVPLLPVQQYFFANQFSALDHWNQSFLVETPSLSLHKLRESFAQLIAHHDNFKLRYQKVEAPLGAHYRQYYDPDAQPEELKLLDINSLGVPEDSPEFSEHLFSILTQWQSGFNLETGPLYCIGYLYGYQDGRARIYFALHHLIVDTVSWRILVEDLKDLYNAQPLGIKGSSYRQWVRAVQDYANSHETERNYWSSIMTDYDGHKLETLATSSSSFDVHAHQEELTLTKEKTKTLLQKSNQAYQTDINDLLLAALACTLKDLTGDCINHICMEGHGREEINPHLDITKTSGWFTTIYPVRLETRDDIGRTIRVMKETLRTLPNKGIGYGALVGYSEGLNELPKVSFNYLGQFDGQDHASSSWKIVDEISGQALSPLNKNRAIIDINGLIIDGVLHFSIASALDDQKTKDFTQCFQSHLEHVIDHTAHLGRTYLTISDVGHIIEQEYLDQLQKDQEIVGVYLANSLQQGFIYHALNQGEWDDAYKIQLIWTYHHKLNEEKLQQAWQYAQARYPALRLRFSWDPDLVQVVDKKGMPLDWSFIDISDIKDAAQQALKIKQIQQEDRKKAYDLEKGPLFRIILIKEQDQRYTCLLSYNHAILDGWSNPVLLDYVHETYLKLLDKKPVNTQTDTSYGDTQKYLQEQKGLDQDYWSTYLSTIEDRTDLSGLLTASARNSQVRLSEYRHIQNSQEETLLIAEDLYQRIKELGQQEGVTTNAILQYAWHTVLSLCGHSQQTIVGTTVSGRDLPIDNIESSVGLYINTLPLIVNHQADQPIAMIDIIRSIQDNTNNISVRSNVNLASLQAKGERLFDSLFIYENYPDIVGGAASDQRLNITFEGGIEKLDYPLSVIVGEESGKILFTIKYAGELFDQERIKDIKDILHHLLSQLTQYPTQYHQHLNYLPLNQYEKMIKDWNATDILYGSDQTIIDFFEEQVGKTPDAIAVIYEENQLTYMQLNQKANQLAHHLRQTYAISPDDPIALCLDRNEQMLIGILGILKAGGCYVPIGPNYPDERVKYILNDTNTKVVLVNEIHQKKLQNLLQKADVLVLDCPLMQMKLSDSPVTNPSPLALSSSLAYIIYTSGTTGNPKGVMIEHRGVVNRIQWMNQTYPLTEHDRILQKTPYVFDVSVWELLWAHWYGATIVFAKPEGHKDAAYIKEIISKERVTITHFVPSMLSVFEETLDHIGSDLHEDLANLRYIFCSGEALSLEQVTKCHHLLPWVSVHNLYGPTEASIDVLSYDCSDPEIKAVYIGKPIANTTAYVLNSSLQPVPIGGIGELHIGGMGLARGYLNQPELTAEKFIGNPFQSEEEKISGRNDRLYKTGDLVRWLSDGNIEYIGRNDFQVKIRGHRIELGEIESLLSTYEGIKQSVVVAKNHESTDGKGHLYLGGYYVSDHPLNEDEIRSYLHSQLPDYMVPTFLMWVASLPLTINGKLDRKALPTPELSHQETYIAPRSEEERKICSIWGEVLGLSSQVGIRDDFFRLGGDSIMAIKLVNKLNKEFDKKFSILGILKSRTIENLTSYLDNNHQNMTIYKTDIAHPENQTLSFAQERLWFIEKYEEGTNAYNLPMVFLLLPTTNLTTLKTSIQAIVQRHEILRTVIKESSEGSGYQFVLNDTDNFLEIKTVYVTSQEQLNETINSEVNHIYDLKTEHPIRVSFYELNDLLTGKKENYLSIVVHHIAFDGWSVDIFWKELHAYYDYYTRQQEGAIAHLNLPELTIQYKDFALWQRDYLSGERLQEQLDYWLKQLEDYENLNLVTDLVRPKDIDYRGHNICFEIDQETSSDLRLLAKSLGVSLYSVLLGGYAIMLKAYSNQQDIVIGTPVANRHYPQVEHLIGFLVNSLALRIKIDDQLSIRDYIKQVGEIVVQAQLHQDLPFEKLVEQLDLEKNTSQHPIFQVMFEVQNFGGAKNTFLSPYKADFSTAAHFDISTSVDDSQDCITGVFNYAISLYEEGTIKRFIQTYKNILKQLTKSKTNKIADLNYLEPPHYQKIIYDWNATHKEYFIDKTIDQLFEEQVDKIPDHIAVVHNSIRLTYRTLNEKSNQLAHYLRENYNIKPESPFAFCLDKSPSMIVVILAILKAGGAYVPIDPECPDERIQYILKDTGSQLLITSESYMDRFNNIRRSSAHNFSALAIDSNDFQEQLDKQFIVNPKRISSNKNLVYIVYTSGTTGHPKGVMIGHKSLVTTYLGWELKYGLKDITNHLQMAGSSFDVFSGDFVRALLSGGKLILCSKQVLLRPEKLHQLIVDEHVEIAEFVPAVLNNLVDYLEDNRIKLDGIKLLISGSDCLLKKDYLRIRNICSSGARIINSYGLTETVIDSLYFEQTALDFLNESLPIGCPLPDTAVYVLDNQLRPLPVGAIGELYIGGDRLARGYLNRPELTAEKFIANPFQNEEEKISGYNDRLYKTGDLVRWLPDGNIEYIGRNDFQVKIRGHRIELGEIESVLSAFEGVKQCIVVAKNQESTNDNGHRHLVGYYVCDHPLNEDDIRNYLQSQLPDYMVPTVLIHLKELPLNLNGKIDRKALPVPGFTSTQTYVAPRNEIESKLCAIWADVLGLSYDKVGIKDGFFRLGGNSILVIKLINEINKKFKSHIKVADIFVYKEVELLLPRIIQTKDRYQTVVKLNSSYELTNMFMIHPGEGGCESYCSLANALKNYFSCYGIDSYNLYHNEKIKNLNNLAEYYLSYIENIMINTNQDYYHILGWSFGGQIALEIAAILEKRNIKKIKIYLLDTTLNDEYLLSLKSNYNINDDKDEYRIEAKIKNYDKNYIEKVVSNIEVEYLLSNQSISSALKDTKILLFKAMLVIEQDQFKKINQHLKTLKFNNVDNITTNKFNLKLIKVNNAYHETMLEQEDFLVFQIVSDNVNENLVTVRETTSSKS